ncbi:cupredoxin domain-containing protein [Nocardioides montaniterrae]
MKPMPVVRLLAVAASLALGLLVLLVGPPAQAAAHHVDMAGYAFSPSALTVDVGDTVTWTNHDPAPHDVTVTSGPQTVHSPMLSRGQSWTFTFQRPGTYSYICSVHPDMRASVTVAAAPAPSRAAVPPSMPSSSVAPHAAPRGPARHPAGAASHPRKVATPVTPAPTASDDRPAMSPLVLVAGAAAAVIVFSLLLMAARPTAAGRDISTG